MSELKETQLAEVASHCIVKLYYSFQDAEYLTTFTLSPWW
jgi:hypothetical protein